MIKVIYGAKGSGKTTRVLDMANDALKTSKGEVVFITDTDRYNPQINHSIRVVNTKIDKITSCDLLKGLITGMLSANRDITDIFIDGVARITGLEIGEMSCLFSFLETIATDELTIYITISSDILPDFIAKYAI